MVIPNNNISTVMEALVHQTWKIDNLSGAATDTRVGVEFRSSSTPNDFSGKNICHTSESKLV